MNGFMTGTHLITIQFLHPQIHMVPKVAVTRYAEEDPGMIQAGMPGAVTEKY